MSQDTKDHPLQDAAGVVPLDRLGQECRNLAGAIGGRVLTSMAGKVSTMTGRLTEYAVGGVTKADSSPGAGLLSLAGQAAKGVTKGALKGVLGGGGKKAGGGDKIRVTNVVESIDIGAPIHVVYNQWTQFEDFPTFMKKVENVKQESDEQLTWKAQIFWSHRTWKSEITEQAPDERIIWRSEGEKGYVDGAVTFHELAPALTRVILILEYHPQGFFEHVGNVWRAQGRRARLELKHFGRHVMTQLLLHPEEIQGWRGKIHEGQVVKESAEAEQEGEREGEQAGEAQPREKAGESTAERPEEARKSQRARSESGARSG
ncbi:MAG TPA: SRPBCC family protein [Thermopolyspora sp.]|jgi:Predicted integral membrane protein